MYMNSSCGASGWSTKTIYLFIKWEIIESVLKRDIHEPHDVWIWDYWGMAWQGFCGITLCLRNEQLLLVSMF